MIYIIIPTFGRIEETKKFLNSINESINKEYLCLIIDDHPDNVTYSSIKQNKNIRIITSVSELWWVGSINLGIKLLYEEYYLSCEDIVIFANNDIEIDKNNFTILYKELQKDNNQIVHPRTFNHHNVEVSSGAKILNFLPYITKHPKNFVNEKELIDMGTARFLMMRGGTLKKVSFINKDLIQYLGDNYFTLSASRFFNIKTYILRDAICKLDDTNTGIKNSNIKTIKEVYESFSSIKSPNNIKYRYIFFSKFFNNFFSLLIVASMTLNVLMKYILNKLR